MSTLNHQDNKILREEAARLRAKGVVDSVVVSGMKIEYWRVGEGANAWVFIHGNSSCKEVFFQQLNLLKSGNISLIAIDLPGHGCTDNAMSPKENYTIPGYAKIVGKVMLALGFESYGVLGWSLGGNIAMEMAGQGLPVTSMMIMGAPPIGPGIENVEKAFLPSSLEATGKADLTDNELNDFARAIYGTLAPIPAALALTAKRTHGMAREIMIGHWMSGESGHKQTDTIAQWRHPIAVIHGENDPFVALDYLNQAHWKNLWGDKVHVIDSVGHAPFVENPPIFNKLLMDFINATL